MVREADTEAEETARKEKLEVNFIIIFNIVFIFIVGIASIIIITIATGMRMMMQEKVQEWMTSLGSKLEEKSQLDEDKVFLSSTSSTLSWSWSSSLH